jgi:hypothetical protein
VLVIGIDQNEMTVPDKDNLPCVSIEVFPALHDDEPTYSLHTNDAREPTLCVEVPLDEAIQTIIRLFLDLTREAKRTYAEDEDDETGTDAQQKPTEQDQIARSEEEHPVLYAAGELGPDKIENLELIPGRTRETTRPTSLHLIQVWGDVEPILFGPYATEEDRDAEARRLHEEDEGTLIRLDIEDGRPEVLAFTDDELDED